MNHLSAKTLAFLIIKLKWWLGRRTGTEKGEGEGEVRFRTESWKSLFSTFHCGLRINELKRVKNYLITFLLKFFMFDSL